MAESQVFRFKDGKLFYFSRHSMKAECCISFQVTLRGLSHETDMGYKWYEGIILLTAALSHLIAFAQSHLIPAAQSHCPTSTMPPHYPTSLLPHCPSSSLPQSSTSSPWHRSTFSLPRRPTPSLPVSCLRPCCTTPQPSSFL